MPTTSWPTSTRRLHRHKTWPAVVWLAVSSVLALLAFAGASQGSESGDGDILYDADLAIGGVVFYGLMIVVSFLIALRVSTSLRDALGFRRFRLRWVWIALGVVVLTTIVAVAVEPFLHGGEDQGLAADRWEPEHAGVFAVNVVVLVLLGPFAEELFFRGLGVRVAHALRRPRLDPRHRRDVRPRPRNPRRAAPARPLRNRPCLGAPPLGQRLAGVHRARGSTTASASWCS